MKLSERNISQRILALTKAVLKTLAIFARKYLRWSLKEL